MLCAVNLTARQRSIITGSAPTARHRALSFLHRSRHTLENAISDAGIAYYASRIPGKESWVQTDEGYRTYLNVPIARTGSQQYLGCELKKNRGYKPEWNLRDDEMVTVLRPLEEVTHPAAIASFENKSVLDEHPEGDKILIDALDELDGYTKGHGHNVRVGTTLDSGETSIIADLTVKHPELNLKIDGIGCLPVRDVSCGYTFVLDRDEAGQYIQRQIRGNHIAIVPKGRAGSEVGIGDAAPDLRFTRRTTMAGRFAAPKTPIRDFFAGLGFKKWSETATDEAVADALKEMSEGAKDEDEKETEAEKEAREKKEKEGAKDGKGKGAKDEDEHPDGCRCTDCMGAKDEDLEDVDAEEESAADKKKGAKDGKKGAKDDAEILSPEDRAESDWDGVRMSVKDSAAELRLMKPAIAASKDPKVREAYNANVKRVRSLMAGAKDGALAKDPYLALVSPGGEDGANDAEPEIPMYAFFNGKSHADGLKDYNDYVQSRQRRS